MADTLDVTTHDPRNPAEWHDHITRFGYVIVHDAVPAPYLQATIDDIWRHTGADPNTPETWYRADIIRPVGMVEMYHYQSMWNNRQHPHVYDIFRAIHGTDQLSVSIDRVGLKPPDNPRHPEYNHRGMIHWDTQMSSYPDIPFHVQGVLALTDTEPDMGGFQCIPEIYQHLGEYLATQTPEKIESRNPDYSGYTITRPRLAAGDLLVWTSLLLHGNGHNTSDRPRLCQYISMNPAAQQTEETRSARIECWRANTHPSARSFPGDPRKIEEQRSAPAELTELGRKLLGLERWN
ncbi:MAG: phytanoyl-CoA dioxygenase family protein [Chloroflexi bacterium]|nr:phytanoyl-CoA dioxygenase family protein [Chloroflexota bacterium]